MSMMNRTRPFSGSFPLVLLLSVAARAAEEPRQGVRTLEGHGGSVMAAVFAPDGKVLVTSSRDKTIKFWDTGTFEETGSQPAPSQINSIAFSPDGQALAVASNDGKVRLLLAASKLGMDLLAVDDADEE